MRNDHNSSTKKKSMKKGNLCMQHFFSNSNYQFIEMLIGVIFSLYT